MTTTPGPLPTLYEKLFNSKNFWQRSLLHSIIFISNIKISCSKFHCQKFFQLKSFSFKIAIIGDSRTVKITGSIGETRLCFPVRGSCAGGGAL